MNNQYTTTYFPEIDRTLQCQTIETMFANKLVAAIDRYKRKGAIAGRDYFDICQFFQQKIIYNKEILKEYEPAGLKIFFHNLIQLTKKEFTEQVINEDLNMLLLPKQFQFMRKNIKQFTLDYLEKEYNNLT